MRSLLYTAMGMAAVVAGSSDRDDDASNVAVLGAGNFTEYLEQNPVTMVEFYAPWCGHCKNLEPHWNAAANILSDKKAKTKLAKVDATIESALAADNGVNGYPTIKYCVSGECTDYNGPRERQGIVDWILKRESPNVKKFRTEQNANDWAKKQSGDVVIAYVASKKAEGHFRRLTSQLVDMPEVFGYVVVSSPADEKLVIHRKQIKTESAVPQLEDEELVITESNKALESVEKFKTAIEDARFAKVGSPRSFSAMRYVHENKHRTVAVLVLPGKTSPQEEMDYAELINKLAQRYPSVRFTLAIEGESQLASVQDSLGNQNAPELIILDKRHGHKEYLKTGNAILPRKYRLGEVTSTSEAELSACMSEWQEGKAVQYLKSQERTAADESFGVENNKDGHVLNMVASDFDDELFAPKNADKDFLVMYHAPWCGHCKSMKPAYGELADTLHKMGQRNIRIAAVDATANDIPIDNEVQGYPTLVYYPAASKRDARLRNKVKYQGARDVQAMLNFIEGTSEVWIETPKNKRDEL